MMIKESMLPGRVPVDDVQQIRSLAETAGLEPGDFIRAMTTRALADPEPILGLARTQAPVRAGRYAAENERLRAVALALVAKSGGVSLYRLWKALAVGRGRAVQLVNELIELGLVHREPGRIWLVDESTREAWADLPGLEEFLQRLPRKTKTEQGPPQRPVITDEQIREEVLRVLKAAGPDGVSGGTLRKEVRGQGVRIDQAVADLEMLGKVDKGPRRVRMVT